MSNQALKVSFKLPFERKPRPQTPVVLWSCVTAAALAILLSSCSGPGLSSSEKQLSSAAEAINSAIETDLHLDNFEYVIVQGAILDHEPHELYKVSYIGVKNGDETDYYISSEPDESGLFIENKILGDKHYVRLTDIKSGKQSNPFPDEGESKGLPELLEQGWHLNPDISENNAEYYKERLWIWKNRVIPEDFGKVQKKKENGITTYLLSRSGDQLKQHSLQSNAFFKDSEAWYDEKLSEEGLSPDEKAALERERQEIIDAWNSLEKVIPRTLETLEAVIDQEGRLLKIQYQYDYPIEGKDAPDGTTTETLIKYYSIELNHYGNGVSLPE